MIEQGNYTKKVEELTKNITGLIAKKLVVKNKEIYILYIPQITNREGLSENIIKPLLQYNGDQILTAELIINSVIYIDDVFSEEDESKIVNYIVAGKSIVFISGDSKYLVANTLKIEKRNIESPEIESGIRSPKDAFNENLDSNLSLIRYRIKDPSLKVDYYIVGRRTKTPVAVIYLKDVANPVYVEEIKKRLSQIDIDGVLESGYIQKFISDKNGLMFPQIGISERSDTACANILEGKVCIIVEGSNLSLIAPKSFIEFFDAGDDHYDNHYAGILFKILRFLSLLVALTLSALYVTVVAFHPDILPSQYILAIAASRVGVPINAVIEAILMEGMLELLREANLRLPKQIGTSISIVGTIVIGQAAVFAGVVSPLMVIIVALSSMASFAVTDYTLISPIRILKFLMIILSGVYGIFGFIMGLTIVVIKVTSIESFGIPYTVPVAPFNFKDLKDLITSNPLKDNDRPKFLNLKNKKRK
ncbi:spore germination protein [Clostridiaceae bacterium UIB06]|uniref:Spore germination protein n=1 Tax=Clostridium thailandense TaxID=2794346 RepID=A0A949WXJ8_9CLOT|nr:spore germination protein [Clostridium thailandense]MBV7276037.1 spore germination protein [Clostridium thailandense]MCH5137004.1 spore germination protein [Clostridiaceae bacterium UIB06]